QTCIPQRPNDALEQRLLLYHLIDDHRDLHSFPTRRSSDLAQPVTTNLLKFMRASIKMIGVSNLQSFIASMTQKLTLSDISDESKNYLDKAGITTACLRIKSKWTAGGK